MTRWAVAYIDWSNYDLTIKIVEAPDWYSALLKHEGVARFALPNSTLEEAKKAAYDCDAMIDVVQIT